MDKNIKYKKEDIEKVIFNIDEIRVTIAKFGRLYHTDYEKMLLLQNLFILENNLYQKLNEVYKILSAEFKDKNELELDNYLENKEYWEIPFELDKYSIQKRINKIVPSNSNE